MKYLFLLLFSSSALAQYEPTIHVSWDAVTMQEDGTLVDTSDVSYSVFNEENGESVCETSALRCDIPLTWGACMTIHAKAYQQSTGLWSDKSNSINACGGDRPNFRLAPPLNLRGVVDNYPTLQEPTE